MSDRTKIDDIIDFLIAEAEKSQVTLPSEQQSLFDAAKVVRRHQDYFKRIYHDED